MWVRICESFSFFDRCTHVFCLIVFAVFIPLVDFFLRHGVFLDSHDVGVSGVAVCLVLLFIISLFLASFEFAFRLVGWKAYCAAIFLNNSVMFFLIFSYVAFGVVDLSSCFVFLLVMAFSLLAGYLCAFVFSSPSFKSFFLLLISFLFSLLLFFGVRSSYVLPASSVVSPKHSLILLVFDEFPLKSILDSKGGISRDKFPAFFELSQYATWFKNATAVAWETQLAVPAIVTGRYPELGGSFNIYENNLFTLVDPDAVSHVVVEPVLKLSPPSFRRYRESIYRVALKNHLQFVADSSVLYAHLVFPKFLRSHFPSIDNSWFGYVDLTRFRDYLFSRENKVNGAAQFIGDRRKDQYFEYLSQIQKARPPMFHFVHVLLPHRPWVYDELGRAAAAHGYSGVLFGDEWTTDPLEVSRLFALHEKQVQFVDSLVGKTIRVLKENGLFDDSLIIITSDHGASFLPGGHRREPTKDNLLDIARVPLFMKFPNQKEGYLTEVDAQLIDVFPTIVDVLKLSPTWEMHGRSLVNSSSSLLKNRKLYGKDGEIFEFSLE